MACRHPIPEVVNVTRWCDRDIRLYCLACGEEWTEPREDLGAQ